MARHTVDARTSIPQRDPGFSMKALANRRCEVVVQRVADELMMEGETITRSAEQTGFHRRGQCGQQLRRRPARQQRQLGNGERRAENGGDPQQVQPVLG